MYVCVYLAKAHYVQNIRLCATCKKNKTQSWSSSNLHAMGDNNLKIQAVCGDTLTTPLGAFVVLLPPWGSLGL